MTKEEWCQKLLLHLASGHSNVVMSQQAKDYLAGKEPPIDWEPTAVKKHKDGKDE